MQCVQDSITALEKCRWPIIAAIQGMFPLSMTEASIAWPRIITPLHGHASEQRLGPGIALLRP